MTIQEYFVSQSNSKVVIVDEYDDVMINTTFINFQIKLFGLWQFTDKRIIAFSASESKEIERYIEILISKPHFSSSNMNTKSLIMNQI